MQKALRSLIGRLFLSSGGSVAQPFGLRESRRGALLPETLTRSSRIGFFISSPLQELVLDGPENKKPGEEFRRVPGSRLYDSNI